MSSSFYLWAALMMLVVLGLIREARKSRPITARTEEAASKALPVIGEIAVSQHTQRFGRPPSNVPKRGGVRASWYPQTKAGKKVESEKK